MRSAWETRLIVTGRLRPSVRRPPGRELFCRDLRICRAACGEAGSTYCGEVVSKFYLYFQAVLGLTVEVIEKDINRLRVIIG